MIHLLLTLIAGYLLFLLALAVVIRVLIVIGYVVAGVVWLGTALLDTGRAVWRLREDRS